MPKQREYANHVYDGLADGRLGTCLLFTTRKKWTTTRRTLELAGCRLKQDGDTEGFLTFDPTNAEQVRAVVKAGGLKARRMASPERLMHLASAKLRRVADPPIEHGGSAARKHSLTQQLQWWRSSDFTHNWRVGDNDCGIVQHLSLKGALDVHNAVFFTHAA